MSQNPGRTELISFLLVIDASTLECDLLNISSQLIPLLANIDRMLSQLGPKGSFNHQYCGKRINVYLVEKPIEPPPHPLPCHLKRLVNLLTISALKDHIAGPTRFQFHP